LESSNKKSKSKKESLGDYYRNMPYKVKKNFSFSLANIFLADSDDFGRKTWQFSGKGV